jgi:hypothetical protein
MRCLRHSGGEWLIRFHHAPEPSRWDLVFDHRQLLTAFHYRIRSRAFNSGLQALMFVFKDVGHDDAPTGSDDGDEVCGNRAQPWAPAEVSVCVVFPCCTASARQASGCLHGADPIGDGPGESR